jgi:hypothetical protein
MLRPPAAEAKLMPRSAKPFKRDRACCAGDYPPVGEMQPRWQKGQGQSTSVEARSSFRQPVSREDTR